MAEVITIGSDKTVVLTGARDSVTGDYLDSATVAYTLYTAAGVSVDTGTLTYIAASNGNYAGVIQSTVTATLTAGAAYYSIITFSENPDDAAFRVDYTAQQPGGIIIDTDLWQESSSISLSGADLAACRRMCLAVSEALERKCYPVILVPKTLTLFPFDAPPTRELLLPRPIRSISAIYYHPRAGGDSSVVDTTADLLAPNLDYHNRPTDVLTGWNRTGIVMRLRGYAWGWQGVRNPDQLNYYIAPEDGSVFVSGEFGPAAVSPTVQQAAALAVTLLFNRRKTGAPLQSESWNGYSGSYASAFFAQGALESPDVLALLRDAGALPVHVG